MFENDKQLFELEGDLHDRRQNHEKRAVLFAGGQLVHQGLHDLGALQEAMKILQHHECRLVAGSEAGGSPDGGQWISRCSGCRFTAGYQETPVDVPGGQLPTLLPAELGDLRDCVILFMRNNPQAGEARARTPPAARLMPCGIS